MKVSELIELLKKCNPNEIVIMSSDGEGNYYRILGGIDKTSCWDGENVGLRELTDEDRKIGYSEEDVLEDGVNCVILFPEW